ncbi:16S rRNA (cytidine(1402)-2'-O)-methyltransferase [Actinospongicola halichondriae]|uniref:16S rRNA (cytidine(1402)-2'-O)-methyltransferase n=1 Tax=Actinospongicola halichondriae TaxID=3236844 RepID=UPI003D5BC1CE
MRGRLVVVGTPIGNLGDLSPRAAEVLAEADVLACEDTRRTGRLLSAAGIAAPKLVVVNEHTEAEAATRLVDQAQAGAVVALVTDAGMPSVSDPGAVVVEAMIAAGIDVSVVPGPTAASAALAASGLPSSRWVFEGFLPRKGSGRSSRLAAVAAEERTAILYEAPHRMVRTIDDLLDRCDPSRRVVFGREITKLHEEWFRGTLAEAARWLVDHEPRGEFVVVLAGASPAPEATDEDLVAALAAERRGGASTRDAVAAVTDRYGVSKRRVYDLANAAEG